MALPVAAQPGAPAPRAVVIDSWADWRPPCRQMWPHERQLVEELKDEPFVFLGVYAEAPESLQPLIDSGEVTWNNWGVGKQRAALQTWRITALPTLYVVDSQGVIRHRAEGYVPKERLEAWVRGLLQR